MRNGPFLLPRGALLTAALAVALAGCTPARRVDATSPSALTTSLNKYALLGGGRAGIAQRREWTNRVADLYVRGGKWKSVLAGLPPPTVFQRASFQDLDHLLPKVLALSDPKFVTQRSKLVDQSKEPFLDEEEDATRRIFRNRFIAEQLEITQTLLTERREQARYKDLFTVDQMAFLDASFIPPQVGAAIGQDYATFAVKFHNTTGFNLYKPTFRVTVTVPGSELAVLDTELTYDPKEDGKSATSKKVAIGPGQTQLVLLTCCTSFTDPRTNMQLRTLPPDAKIDMNLVGIDDYASKNLLEKSGYTAQDHASYLHAVACLNEIKKDPAGWRQVDESEACTK